MDFGRALSFPFDDEEWPLKFIIGMLLSLVPFFAQGYQVQVARNVVRGSKRPLPAHNRLGQVFADGVVVVTAGVVYFLPLLVLGCIIVVPAILAGESDLGFLLTCSATCCLFFLALAYAIPAMMLVFMGIIRYAETGNYGEYFRLGALVHDVRQNAGLLATLWLYTFLLALLGAIIAPFASVLIVGAPLLGFYYHIVTGHLIGQAGQMILVDY